MQDATDARAGAPGAGRVPSCFSAAEIAIIERARQWGVCSFNDFRSFLGLKGTSCRSSSLPVLNDELVALKSFKEWNSNPNVGRAAEELYGNIDNLELYVSPCVPTYHD